MIGLWAFGMAVIVVIVGARVFAQLLTLRDEVRGVRERLERLEHEAATRGAAVVPVPAPEPPADVPLPPPVPLAAPPLIPQVAPVPGRSMEQWVGGVWLQNAGSVLVLLGVFFLILWGYTSGRLGAGLLVVAGVGLGLAFVWRGDRTVRDLPAFGQALIGVGLGIVYLSLYLGHFTLHVLDQRAAFALLALVSLGAVGVGLRYGAQTIAALGVIGAFVPELLVTPLGLRGFSITPAAALGYFALVDLAVFALAARAGWAVLDLAALSFTTLTWIVRFTPTPAPMPWGWTVELGLAALYLVLGLAPLPRLAARRDRTEGPALAVVALAPLMFLGASWPFLSRLATPAAAALLMGLALAYVLAALWVDRRREDQDLWRPLTAAATVFLTAALERAVGDDSLAMTWALESVALVWLGRRARGAWIRVCGYTVGVLAGLVLFTRLATATALPAGALPILNPDGLRDVVTLGALFAVAAMMRFRRAPEHDGERMFGRVWTLGVNLLVLVWSVVESAHVAASIQSTPVDDLAIRLERAARRTQTVRTLAAVITSGVWTVQAAVLLAIGWWRGSAFMRWLGLGLFGLTVLKLLVMDLRHVDVFWRFLTAIAIGAALLAVSYAYQRRARAVEAAGVRAEER